MIELISTHCPDCNANIKINFYDEATKCEFCGANIVVSDIIDKLDLSGVQERNAKLTMAKKHRKYKEYNEADVILRELTEKNPFDIDAFCEYIKLIVDMILDGIEEKADNDYNYEYFNSYAYENSIYKLNNKIERLVKIDEDKTYLNSLKDYKDKIIKLTNWNLQCDYDYCNYRKDKRIENIKALSPKSVESEEKIKKLLDEEAQREKDNLIREKELTTSRITSQMESGKRGAEYRKDSAIKEVHERIPNGFISYLFKLVWYLIKSTVIIFLWLFLIWVVIAVFREIQWVGLLITVVIAIVPVFYLYEFTTEELPETWHLITYYFRINKIKSNYKKEIAMIDKNSKKELSENIQKYDSEIENVNKKYKELFLKRKKETLEEKKGNLVVHQERIDRLTNELETNYKEEMERIKENREYYSKKFNEEDWLSPVFSWKKWI